MKLRTILVSSLLVTATFSANAFDFLDTLKQAFGLGEKKPAEQVQQAAQEKTPIDTSALESVAKSALSENALVDYAAEQLGLSPEIATGALGALFKVAKDNLGDNFSSITDVIPGVENYIKNAPSESTSAISGLASSLGKDNDKVQAMASLGYLNSAFKKLGIPKETILPLIDTVSNYLENNNYGSAAEMLKKGVNFL